MRITYAYQYLGVSTLKSRMIQVWDDKSMVEPPGWRPTFQDTHVAVEFMFILGPRPPVNADDLWPVRPLHWYGDRPIFTRWRKA